MGIEIQLSGCEKRHQRACNKLCDAAARIVPGQFTQPYEALEFCRRYVNGKAGNLSSAFNPRGDFHILDHGFDAAALLFPGDWNFRVPIDGRVFLRNVKLLKEIERLAMERKVAVPWIHLFTELTGQTAPDAHPDRLEVELASEILIASVEKAIEEPLRPWPLFEKMSVETLNVRAILDDFHDFGKLAKKLNSRGEPTFAMISYPALHSSAAFFRDQS
jgi:hypothetical protein